MGLRTSRLARAANPFSRVTAMISSVVASGHAARQAASKETAALTSGKLDYGGEGRHDEIYFRRRRRYLFLCSS